MRSRRNQLKIQAAPRDVHPEGTYFVTIRAVRDSGPRSFTNKTTGEVVNIKESCRVGVQSESGQYAWDTFDGDGAMAWRLTALWEAVHGRRTKKDEIIDTDSLVDRQVGLTITHNEGAQGTFTNFKDFVTIPAASAAAPGPKKVLPLAAKTKPTLRPLPGALKKSAPKK